MLQTIENMCIIHSTVTLMVESTQRGSLEDTVYYIITCLFPEDSREKYTVFLRDLE